MRRVHFTDKKRAAIVLLAMLLTVAATVILPHRTVRAASDYRFVTKKLTVGMNNRIESDFYLLKKNSLKLKFSSSDKKIATVNSKGVIKTKAKTGKVTITVRRMNNKKLGKLTLTVKKPELSKRITDIESENKEGNEAGYAILKARMTYYAGSQVYYDDTWAPHIYDCGSEDWYYSDYMGSSEMPADRSVLFVSASRNYIRYANPKAKYTFKSSDPDMLTIAKDGTVKSVGERTGKVKITVSQTYNKKTTKVGTFTLYIEDPGSFMADNGRTISINRYRWYDYFNQTDSVTEDSLGSYSPFAAQLNFHTLVDAIWSMDDIYGESNMPPWFLPEEESTGRSVDDVILYNPDSETLYYRGPGKVYLTLYFPNVKEERYTKYLGKVIINVTDNSTSFNRALSAAKTEFNKRYNNDPSESFEEYFKYTDYKEYTDSLLGL